MIYVTHEGFGMAGSYSTDSMEDAERKAAEWRKMGLHDVSIKEEEDATGCTEYYYFLHLCLACDGRCN